MKEDVLTESAEAITDRILSVNASLVSSDSRCITFKYLKKNLFLVKKIFEKSVLSTHISTFGNGTVCVV